MVRWLRWVYTVWVGICFIVPMVAFLPLFLIYPVFGFRANLWLASVTMLVWFRLFLVLVGIRLRIVDPHGYRRLRPAVLITNHTSFLDTPVVKTALGFNFLPLGKKEQSRTPVLGWIYRHNVVLVDRSSAESRARSFQFMDGLLKRAIGVFVFPEGTMNRGPLLLKSFYDGAFRLSVENQVPVVPFAVTATRLIMPRGVFPLQLPRAVTVVFGPPILPNGATEADLPRLKQAGYDAVFDLLSAHAPAGTPGLGGAKAPLEPARARPDA